MKIGILGGTFNPVHYGHLEMAKEALRSLSLNQVWFMPVSENRMKQQSESVAGEIRIEMLEAALQETEDDRIKISLLEFERGGISYTFDTYHELKTHYPDYEFLFLYGTDCLYTIERWYQGAYLLENLKLVFVSRKGYDKTMAKDRMETLCSRYGSDMRLLDCQLPDISSSMVRNLCIHNMDYYGLVPGKVAKIIRDKRLYHERI